MPLCLGNSRYPAGETPGIVDRGIRGSGGRRSIAGHTNHCRNTRCIDDTSAILRAATVSSVSCSFFCLHSRGMPTGGGGGGAGKRGSARFFLSRSAKDGFSDESGSPQSGEIDGASSKSTSLEMLLIMARSSTKVTRVFMKLRWRLSRARNGPFFDPKKISRRARSYLTVEDSLEEALEPSEDRFFPVHLPSFSIIAV